jgi:hypothetical protein
MGAGGFGSEYARALHLGSRDLLVAFGGSVIELHDRYDALKDAPVLRLYGDGGHILDLSR